MRKKKVTPNVALITGAARRIGAEIACFLHANGMNVVLHYRNSGQEAKRLCAALNKRRAQSAVVVHGDLLIMASLDRVVKQAVKAWGHLDVLVNNASEFFKTPLGKTSEQDWDVLMAANLKAPFFLAQSAAPYLAKRKGSIVNIADIHAERPMRDYPVYSISKAGLVMLTKVLAKELGPKIRVNAVSPGAIDWPEGKNQLSAGIKKKIIKSTALNRHGDPKEIAKAVVFLAQNADYITGQVLAVDGGRLLFI